MRLLGYPAAFTVNAKAKVAAGAPLAISVQANDAFGLPAGGYSGTVTLTSGDPLGQLPGSYAFTSSDVGIHKFFVILWTPGRQTITISDATGISVQRTVIVSAAKGLTNGGLESGLTDWRKVGTVSLSTTAHSGSFAVQLGATTPTATSYFTQSFTAPYGSQELDLWYEMTCPNPASHDWTTATLRDSAVGGREPVVRKTCTTTTWTLATAAIIPGHKYTLTMINHDDGKPNSPAYTRYDDITTS